MQAKGSQKKKKNEENRLNDCRVGFGPDLSNLFRPDPSCHRREAGGFWRGRSLYRPSCERVMGSFFYPYLATGCAFSSRGRGHGPGRLVGADCESAHDPCQSGGEASACHSARRRREGSWPTVKMLASVG